MRVASAGITSLLALIYLAELIRGRQLIPIGGKRPTGKRLRWEAAMGFFIAAGATLMILGVVWDYAFFFLYVLGCAGALLVRVVARVRR